VPGRGAVAGQAAGRVPGIGREAVALEVAEAVQVTADPGEPGLEPPAVLLGSRSARYHALS
jgi:hypothetical protein